MAPQCEKCVHVLDTDCHIASHQELELSAEVSLLWHHRFPAVRGDLREHHTDLGEGRR